ncbi:MAG TPA: DUF3185 family protein [Planctomycetota bacterium]|nr:DUF3185 family protein [Planctomycetota bacterium]
MRGLGIALLVIGVILLVFGLNARDSMASSVKEAFTGNPTDRAIWLLVGGAALTVVGGATLFVGNRKRA